VELAQERVQCRVLLLVVLDLTFSNFRELLEHSSKSVRLAFCLTLHHRTVLITQQKNTEHLDC
jgi:hypothetical protein